MYSLVFSETAQKQLGKLDRSVAQRVRRKLGWLIANIDVIAPEWLHHEMAGRAKVREGDYRIIYEILHPSQTIVVQAIAHRSEIYKDR